MLDLYSLKACPYRSSVGAKRRPIRVPAIPLLLFGGIRSGLGCTVNDLVEAQGGGGIPWAQNWLRARYAKGAAGVELVYLAY